MPPVRRVRERVLDAAERVLLERGATGFTLDAVIERARVSKGGLIYHFPSKEALLEALVARAVAAVDDRLAAAAADRTPGAFTRAYLDVTVPPDPLDQPDAGAGASTPLDALVAAVSLDPRLLDPLRAAYTRWQARLEDDGIDPAAATAVRLAVDGWWLAAVLRLPPLPAQTHASTRALLERLAAGSTSGSAADPSGPSGETRAWWRS